jgi:hypothetical protein
MASAVVSRVLVVEQLVARSTVAARSRAGIFLFVSMTTSSVL